MSPQTLFLPTPKLFSPFHTFSLASLQTQREVLTAWAMRRLFTRGPPRQPDGWLASAAFPFRRRGTLGCVLATPQWVSARAHTHTRARFSDRRLSLNVTREWRSSAMRCGAVLCCAGRTNGFYLFICTSFIVSDD